MSVFAAEITNLSGVVQTTISQREGLECPVPLNDSRTARVRIPISAAAAAQVKPLERMLRIYYRQSENPDPVFWGVVTDPDWSAASGYVDIVAQDQWERLIKSYARYADVVVGPSTGPPPDSPTDYTTIRNLILAAENTAAQQLAGYPDLGIKRTGTGTSNSGLAAAAGKTMKIERGSNVAQKLQELIRVGTDVQLYPMAGLGATPSGTPYYSALRTFDLQGSDRTASLTFRYQDPRHATIPNNIADASWSPRGSQARNHHVSVVPGRDLGNGVEVGGVRVMASHPQSFASYGPRSGWDNPSGGNTKAIGIPAMEAHASSILERLSRPPNFVTLTAKVEPSVGTNSNPQWLRDFDVGDRVMVYVKNANMDFDALFGGAIEMRIVSVTPRQLDAADNARVDIEVVPWMANPAEFVIAEDT